MGYCQKCDNCTTCNHLNIVDRGNLYAVCDETYRIFPMVSENGTRANTSICDKWEANAERKNKFIVR